MRLQRTLPLSAVKAGALLVLLGAVLFGTTACRKGSSILFWQTHPSQLDSATSDSEASAVASDPGADADRPSSRIYGRDDLPRRDAQTGGFPEVAFGNETRPAGERSPDLETIHFAFDDDALDDEARATLAQNAAFLRENGDLRVVLRGHTDQIGTDEYNLTLGSRRAQRVRDALIELGIAGERIETVSFGRTVPVEPGDNPEAHAANRRVEFFLWEADDS